MENNNNIFCIGETDIDHVLNFLCEPGSYKPKVIHSTTKENEIKRFLEVNLTTQSIQYVNNEIYVVVSGNLLPPVSNLEPRWFNWWKKPEDLIKTYKDECTRIINIMHNLVKLSNNKIIFLKGNNENAFVNKYQGEQISVLLNEITKKTHELQVGLYECEFAHEKDGKKKENVVMFYGGIVSDTNAKRYTFPEIWYELQLNPQTKQNLMFNSEHTTLDTSHTEQDRRTTKLLKLYTTFRNSTGYITQLEKIYTFKTKDGIYKYSINGVGFAPENKGKFTFINVKHGTVHAIWEETITDTIIYDKPKDINGVFCWMFSVGKPNVSRSLLKLKQYLSTESASPASSEQAGGAEFKRTKIKKTLGPRSYTIYRSGRMQYIRIKGRYIRWTDAKMKFELKAKIKD